MLKKLMEQRAMLLKELETMVGALKTETEKDGKKVEEIRAFTAEEQKAYDEKRAKVEELNATIKSLSEARSLDITEPVIVGSNADGSAQKKDSTAAEERAFVEYLRSGKAMETRAEGDTATTPTTTADSNWTPSANGAVIPTSIANKIIEQVKNISPIYAMSTKYNVPGTLSIPYYDETDGKITVGYQEEFSEITATSGKLKSISLGGFLVGALTKVSRSLMDNAQFDILSYVIGKLSEAVALWIDNEVINGTANKIVGLSSAKNVLTSAAANGVTADELIDLQDTVPDVYQPNCVWVMSRKMRSAIRKLKDGDGNFLLNKDATSKWSYTLFGRPVYLSDAVKMEKGKPAIYYGDFSGLAVKMTENFNMEVLREQFAIQHAIGIVAWLELDSKIENDEKIAVLKLKAS